jgi:hypothetical protein
MTRTFLAVAVALVAAPCPAAVVVLSNATGDPVAFRLDGGRTLDPGETRPFPCGAAADVTLADGTVLRLEPYAAYVFVRQKGKTELHGIELPGKAPPAAAAAPAGPPPKVTVKLLVDDAERRTRRVWEPAIRGRFERAAAVVTEHTGVRFEVVAVEEWESPAAAAELNTILVSFEQAVRPAPAMLAVGFTSRRLPPPAGKGEEVPPPVFALAGPALRPHVVVRETEPRAEAERTEVLIQTLGKYLGAVASPDPFSAMRPRLGDGRAVSARFKYGFDPLNTLAMSIWAERLRAGPVRDADDLPDDAKTRLGRVYGALAAALPDEKLPDPYAKFLVRAAVAVAPKPVVPAAPPADAPADPEPPRAANKPLTPKEEAVRRVVRAVAVRAADNARRADGRVRGDALTELLVRTAADVAATEEKDLRAGAFLIGLGVALDDSAILRENPLTSALCKAVETDAERRDRVAALGNPTVRFRRDLCQHFAVSAALTEIVGPEAAEQAGLAKELLDMLRPSGFSFSDLAADLAGIGFAQRVKDGRFDLESAGRTFTVRGWVPSVEGLPDGLPAAKFKSAYGSLDDERFKAAYAAVRKRVAESPGQAK